MYEDAGFDQTKNIGWPSADFMPHEPLRGLAAGLVTESGCSCETWRSEIAGREITESKFGYASYDIWWLKKSGVEGRLRNAVGRSLNSQLFHSVP
jgi:hypothetical protein